MKKFISHIPVFLIVVSNALSAQVSPQDSAQLVNLLSDMVQIESVTGNEKLLGEFLVKWAREQDLEVEIFTDKDSSYNFVVSLYSLNFQKPNYILTGHIDVVPAEDKNWKYPPFSGVIAEDAIWGRGAIDDKGPVAMMLMALKVFKEKYSEQDLPFNISVLILSNEETGGELGAKLVTKSFMHRLNAVAMYGEGGSGMLKVIPSRPQTVVFGVSVNEKRPLWLKIEVKTKSKGHSASSNEPYASKKLIKALLKLDDVVETVHFEELTKTTLRELGKTEGGITGFVLKYSHKKIFWPLVKSYFSYGGPLNPMVSNSITITEINTPKSGYNSILQSAHAILDCRLLPGTDQKVFLKRMKNELGSKVDVEVILSTDAAKDSPIDENFGMFKNAILKNFPDAEVLPFLFPASSDNTTFRLAGVPVYGITPMIMDDDLIATVHNINERMPIDALIKACQTYLDFLEMVQGIQD